MEKSNNGKIKIEDDVNVIIAEYQEVRKEILQFQSFQNKMIFGIFSFYIAIATYILSITVDLEVYMLDLIADDIYIAWFVLLLITANIIILGAFLSFNLTIGRASEYITGSLRYRFSRQVGRNKIFGWEDFYSESKISVLAETIPGVICLIMIICMTLIEFSIIWSLHLNLRLFHVVKYIMVGIFFVLILIIVYWIFSQILKGKKRIKKK